MLQRVLTVVVVALLSLIAVAPSAYGDEIDDEISAYRAKAVEELRAVNEEAVRELEEGDSKLESGHPAIAIEHYKKVIGLAPSSPHGHRRLCRAYVENQLRNNAIVACEKAMQLSDTAVNQSALVAALVAVPMTNAEETRALQISSRAAKSGELASILLHCHVLAAVGKLKDASDCALNLSSRAPSSRHPHLLLAMLAANDYDDDTAHTHIEKARVLGATSAELAPIEARLAEPRPLSVRIWAFAKVFLLGWLTVGVAVAVLGLLLSAITRRMAYNLPTTETQGSAAGPRILRSVYRAVLWLACLLFYMTIPVMLASVVLLGVGAVYAMFAVGRISPYLIVLLLGVVVVTVLSTVTSLFRRVKSTPPGEPLDLATQPRLRELLNEVAAKLETRPIDTVYLTAGTDLAVFEKSTWWTSLIGKPGERCLILGAGVLKDMRLLELKAVLAHEYGHFKNEDTAGGAFALTVNRSVLSLIIGLAQGGAAAWYNPAWWLVRGFYALFIRVSHGASRLQEILADRWAAFAYGADALERGLRHAVRRSIAFKAVASSVIQEAAEEERTVVNLYRSRAPEDFDWDALDEAVEKAIAEPTSPYDSHPSPQERFALAKRLVTPKPSDEDFEERAWSIFDGRTELERKLTLEILENVRNRHGVDVSANKPLKRVNRRRRRPDRESVSA